MYENPEDFIDDEEEKKKKQRRWCIDKALSLAKKRKTKKEKTDMDSDDIVEVADKFDDFLEKR